MKHVDVIVPGPWWNSLTYLSPVGIPSGARVRVPVGRGTRTGFVLRVQPDSASEGNGKPFRLRKISEIVDQQNFVGDELWDLSLWMSSRFLCSRGQVLETMLPRPFLLCKETLETIPDRGGEPCRDEIPGTERVYDPLDRTRWEKYRQSIAESDGKALVLFPEQYQAREFWNSLPPEWREKVCLWPTTNGKKKIDAWKLVRRGDIRAVIGSPGAMFAPLAFPSTVIVEGESSGAFMSQSSPFFNCRTVAARRAGFWGARLILGDSIPSSRIYRQKPMVCPATPKDRLVFVDTKNTHSVTFAGIRGGLRISKPLLEETLKVLNKGKVALWVLDRKGFAGEIVCDDCGKSMTCSSCHGHLRWDKTRERLLCIRCGKSFGLPEKCPFCGGYLLEGNRPGLQALADVARGLIGEHFPLLEWAPRADSKSRKNDLGCAEDGALVVGSRGALGLCDRSSVGLIGWIDADAEAHSPLYSARFQAFRMIWESAWRGHEAADRTVVIQSRTPGKEWQIGLKAGWHHFWERELQERKEFDLPPYAALVQIRAPGENVQIIKNALEEQGLLVLDPMEGGEEIWVQSSRLGKLYRTLAPFMEIGKPLGIFPLFRTWLD